MTNAHNVLLENQLRNLADEIRSATNVSREYAELGDGWAAAIEKIADEILGPPFGVDDPDRPPASWDRGNGTAP